MRDFREEPVKKAPKYDPEAAADLLTRKDPTKHAFTSQDKNEGKHLCHYCGEPRMKHMEEVDCSTGKRIVKKVK